MSGRIAYFPNAGSIVFGEATLDFVDGWGNVGEALTVDLFGLGAHARDSENLSVFYDALLQLAKQDPKACKVSARHRLKHAVTSKAYLRRSRPSRSYPGSQACWADFDGT